METKMAAKTVKAKAPKVKKIKVTGFAPLKFQDHTITQKRSGRFAVVTATGAPVNGAAKETLLLASKVLKGSFKKAASEETTPAAT
jgi:hypothetical protein